MELGATHVLNGKRKDLVEEIRVITASTLGVEYAVDATGVVPVIESMVDALGTLGQAAGIGVTNPGEKVAIDTHSAMSLGKSYTSCTEGDSVPQTVRSLYRL
jgi:aryl-alcohol dehydrogenase